MKTDVYTFEKNDIVFDRINEIVSKSAHYNELDNKKELKLTLLCEELVEMLPNLLEYGSGKFWIENNEQNYEIHVEVVSNGMLSTIERDDLLKVSRSGKNAAAVGIMNKIRIAAEVMLSNCACSGAVSGVSFTDSHYAYYNLGMYQDTIGNNQWSLLAYKQNVEKETEAWDELERSIVANLADDVTVGIIGGKVEIVVKKSF